MQEIKIYSIWDKKAKKYETPFFAFDDVFAGRRFIMLQDETDNPSMLTKFSGEFELHRLGVFNVLTGEFVIEEPEKIMDGKNKEEEKKQ
mgnify:CR=1 FL=1